MNERGIGRRRRTVKGRERERERGGGKKGENE